MKKWQLSKNKMLGFLTAGAIVVTMAGSYAVWDELSTSTNTALTIGKPITLSVGTGITYDNTAEARDWGDTAPVYTSGEVTFSATNIPSGETANLTLTPEVSVTTQPTGGGVTKDDFTVTVVESGSDVAIKDAVPFDASKKYKVKVQPTGANAEKTAETVLDVKLNASLTKATTPAS